MIKRAIIVGITALVFLCANAVAAKAAASCRQMNDRVFGADGMGGDAARFRALKAKIDQKQAAANDRAEYARLAKSILANAKVMQKVHCTAHIVPQVNSGAAQGNTSAGSAQSNGSAGGRSPHGCVGFNGVWQTASGELVIKDGTGVLRTFSFTGNMSGSVYSGDWSDSKTGQRGTFAFMLAPGGDSMFGRFTNSVTGGSGSYTSSCVGPLAGNGM